MPKVNQKKILTLFCFFIFLCGVIFYFPQNKVSAAGLEVQYPTISNQSIDSNTKLPDYVLYLFKAGMFLGFFAAFISLIVAGVMYLLSPIKADLLADAKDRISGAISGLLILALTYLIITTINPQLSVFNFNSPPSAPTPITEKTPAGVYFYKSDCSDKTVQPATVSLPDLGALKNKVHSVGITQDSETQTSYISILYENPNFGGKCQYVKPNNPCQSIDSFASSASVYKLDRNPNGDGVYFYRHSYFNSNGGYFKVDNSQIKGIYIQKLEDLTFNNVPEKEQDCVEYDAKGECANRSPQSLAGENISSVKINGSYLVLFVYFGPKDDSSGIWTSCQEFPTANDINKLGPQQIKWENIRNNNNVVPNYVVIIPIQR